MEQKPDPELERLFVPLRLQQLEENPVEGNFDRTHLQEIHKRIFQDLPELAPGEFRTQDTMKARALESMPRRYVVPYAPAADIGSSLDKTLTELGGVSGLQGMSRDQFAGRMAKLYGDLDHAHPFKEGNSRALRAFTEQLATAAGFDLAWKDLGEDPAKARDKLYIARDKEVINRVYPGLDIDRAMVTQDRREYESFTQIVSPFKDADPLEKIIKDITHRHQDLAAAEAFKGEGSATALQKHPTLIGAYAALAAIDRKAEADGASKEQREIVLRTSRETLAKGIARGEIPPVRIREVTREALAQDLDDGMER